MKFKLWFGAKVDNIKHLSSIGQFYKDKDCKKLKEVWREQLKSVSI